MSRRLPTLPLLALATLPIGALAACEPTKPTPPPPQPIPWAVPSMGTDNIDATECAEGWAKVTFMYSTLVNGSYVREPQIRQLSRTQSSIVIMTKGHSADHGFRLTSTWGETCTASVVEF